MVAVGLYFKFQDNDCQCWSKSFHNLHLTSFNMIIDIMTLLKCYLHARQIKNQQYKSICLLPSFCYKLLLKPEIYTLRKLMFFRSQVLQTPFCFPSNQECAHAYADRCPEKYHQRAKFQVWYLAPPCAEFFSIIG